MSDTLSRVSEIMRDIYNRPEHLVFELRKKWSCPKHKYPRYAKHEYVCSVSSDCPDPYECPHSEYVEVEPQPECCAKASYEQVYDEDGSEIVDARLTGGVEWQLSQPSLLFEALNRKIEGAKIEFDG